MRIVSLLVSLLVFVGITTTPINNAKAAACYDWTSNANFAGDLIASVQWGPYCADGRNWRWVDIDNDGYGEPYMLVGETYKAWATATTKNLTGAKIYKFEFNYVATGCVDGSCNQSTEQALYQKTYNAPSATINYPSLTAWADGYLDYWSWEGWETGGDLSWTYADGHKENAMVVYCGQTSDCSTGQFCEKPTISNPLTYQCKTYTYNLTTSSSSGGTVTSPGVGTFGPYNYNTTVSISAQPNTGYHFVNWTGSGVTAGKVANPNAQSTTITMLGNYTVQANFSPDTFTVTPHAGSNGSVTPSTQQTVTYNNTKSFAINSNNGFHIDSIYGCGINYSNTGNNITSYTATTDPITSNCDVYAIFSINTYSVVPSAGPNGSINPSTTQLINHGSSTSFTVTPNTNYRIDSVTGCNGTLLGDTYTTGQITSDCDVVASFTLDSYTVTPQAGPNGTISPATDQTVIYENTTSFTLTPNTGYHIDTVSGCGGTLAGNTYTTGPITGDCTVSASFAINEYTVTPEAGSNGSISPAVDQTVAHGSTTSFTITPNTGYHIDTVSGCGGALAGNTYTTGAITANCTVSASFAINEYTVTPEAGSNGSISPAVDQTVTHGSTTSFTITPNTGYHIDTVSGCEGALAGNTYTTGAVTANCTVSASFAINEYTVTPEVGPDGSISPAVDQTVAHGNITSFTVTPNPGYHIDTVSGCGGNLVGNTYTTGPVTGDCTVSASFAINEYTVTPEAGSNGSISPATAQTVAHGSITSFTVTPNSGYYIDTVSGCGGTLVGNTYTTAPITGDCTVSASFAINEYTVTPEAGSNGSISPATDQTVAHGSTTSFTLTPNTGYHIDTVSGCGGSLVGNTYTTGAITGNCTVIATFAQNIYSVIPAAGDHGSISPATTQQILHGGSISFAILPETGYHIDTVSGCGGSLNGNTYSVSNVTSDCTVTASFKINEYTVTPSAGEHGSMTPATDQTVSHGDSLSFTITPDANYHILSVTGCGGTLSGTTYTIGSVTGNCTVTATFTIDTYTVTSSAGAHGSISPVGQQEVNHGETASFTVTPDTGYHIDTVTGCDGTLNGTTYTTGSITSACTVSATFSQSDYTVTPLAGANGSISPATAQTILHGSTTSFTITPNTGYHIDTVTGCGGSLNGTTYTTGPITASCTVTASFAQTFYTITATAGPNGSVTPSGTLSLAHGASQTFTIMPNDGYHIDKLFLDGFELSNPADTIPFENITGDHSINVTFAINRYTVVTSSGTNGNISPANNQTVDHGEVLTFTITPDAHYHIASATGCNGSLVGSTYTTGPITSTCTVSATFTIDTYTVTPSAGGNGSIDPATPQEIEYGSSTSFTVTPEVNYHIDSVTGCGGSLAGNLYTTAPIESPCNIDASFAVDAHTLNVSITGKGTGKVSSNLTGIDCPDDCTEEYDYGTTITLTATPENKAVFSGWSGACTGKDITCEVTIDQSKDVEATFITPFPWPMFLPAISGKPLP